MAKRDDSLLGPDAAERTFIPESEWPKVARVARIWPAIYGVTVLSALSWGSILPLMLIGLPRMYGAWHHIMTGLLQHGGLADNVTDRRLNSRTVLMNPVSRFIYWTMNDHVEHLMFPMVPCHRLPALHKRIKDDLPAPTPSILAGYREMWPVVLRQRTAEEFCLRRDLPPTAKPYREAEHSAASVAVPAT
jgi:fatty acid desaturase